MHKIGPLGTLEIEQSKVLVTLHRNVKPSFDTITVSWIVFGLLLFCAPLLGINEKAGLVILIISFVLGYGYHLLWTDHVEMDLNNRTVIRKKRLGGIVYRKITKSLPQKYNFNYSVKRDFLYRNSRKVWLEACSQEQKEIIKLIYFPNTKTFIEFRKIFNQKFPNNRIKTGTNDYTEFL